MQSEDVLKNYRTLRMLKTLHIWQNKFANAKDIKKYFSEDLQRKMYPAYSIEVGHYLKSKTKISKQIQLLPAMSNTLSCIARCFSTFAKSGVENEWASRNSN